MSTSPCSNTTKEALVQVPQNLPALIGEAKAAESPLYGRLSMCYDFSLLSDTRRHWREQVSAAVSSLWSQTPGSAARCLVYGVAALLLCASASAEFSYTVETNVYDVAATNIEYFANAMDMSGDTVAIGAFWSYRAAPRGGAVYVFEKQSNEWHRTAILTAPDAAEDDRFGHAVAIEGDTLAVGAPYHGTDWDNDGAVYVYTRTNTTWTFQTNLVDLTPNHEGQFGTAIDLNGGRLAVGTPLDGAGTTQGRGSVTVFTRSGTMWTHQAEFSSDDIAIGDWFGAGVSMDGDRMLVGASEKPVHAPYSGAAYIFKQSGTNWVQEARLVPDHGGEWDYLGKVVHLCDDYAYLGVPRHSHDGQHSGAVFVYRRDGTNWNPIAELTPPDRPPQGDAFGACVDVAGDLLATGAWADDPFNTGAAYLLSRNGNNFINVGKISGAAVYQFSSFGTAVAFDGRDLVVGAPLDYPDSSRCGSAFFITVDVDTDEDGHENWMEDVAGTDPWDAGAHLRLSIQQTSGVPVAAFSSVSNRQYWIEARTNLLVGQWSRLTNAIPGTDAEIRVPLEPGARSRFLRVGVGNTQ